MAEVVRAETDGGRRRDLGLVAALFVLNVAGVVYFWVGGLPFALLDAVRESLLAAGVHAALAGTIANAVPSALLTLLPAVVVIFLVFRYRPEQIGLVPRRLGLALGLVTLGIALAALVWLAFGQSTTLVQGIARTGLAAVPLTLAIYAAQLFVNGVQEELIFRGAMLSRLLRWLANPHHALVLVAFLFVAMHIPSYLARGESVSPLALAASVLAPQPTGLIWGYLFYRTRSIWPGVIWHTSFTTLGVLFF
jgi:membrane protease YdiL (CAAX protease family)